MKSIKSREIRIHVVTSTFIHGTKEKQIFCLELDQAPIYYATIVLKKIIGVLGLYVLLWLLSLKPLYVVNY